MKIRLIYGDRNVGKTTTCRQVFSALRGLGASVDHYEITNDEDDFEAVLNFKGSKIVIYSAGDDKYYFINAKKLAEKWKCDVLVASISSGIHYKEELSGLELDKDYFWHTLEKVDNAEWELKVTRMALDILVKITEFIKKNNNEE